MSILIDEKTRVVVQGLTGAQGMRDAGHALTYGTRILCGVTPGKGGTSALDLPVYNTVAAAVAAHEVDVSLVYVPPLQVRDAVLEALDAGLKLVVVLAENVPVHDTAIIRAERIKRGAVVVGCNTNGIISPGKCKLGGIGGDKPARVYVPGRIGTVSRSGGMSAEFGLTLKTAGYGMTTAISMGGDAIPCTPMVEYVRLFVEDPDTDAILMFGEPGTPNEQEVADFVRAGRCPKPVIALLAGEFQERYPAGVSFGHAAAMINDASDTVSAKREMLRAAGINVVNGLSEIPGALERLGIRPGKPSEG
ncbi:MAG: succinate--CoA ligase subunit alpha [Hyphomicrobiaceae bacterium]